MTTITLTPEQLADLNPAPTVLADGEPCIVRCDRSGVFYGIIARRDGREIELHHVRQLWSWAGAFTLLALAAVGTLKPKDCRFTRTVDSLVVLDAIEILPVSTVARKSIDAVPEFKP
jgi:hypothetical protein